MENKDEETVKRRIQQYVPDGETGQDLPNRSGVATCFLSSLPHPPTPGMMLSFSSQPQTLSTSTSPLGCTTSLAAVDIMVVSSSEKREYSPCTGHTTSCSSGELMETCPSMMDTSVASDYKSSTLPSASFKVKEAPSKETVEQGEGEEKVPPVVSSVHARGDPQSQLASPSTTPKNEGSTTVNPLPDVPPSVASSEDTSQKGAPPVLPHHAPASHRRRHSSAPLTPTVPSPPNLLVLHQQHQVPTPIVPLPAPCPKRAAQFLSSLAFLRRRRRASSLSSPSSSSSSSSTSTTSSGSRSVRSCTTSSSSSSSSTSSSSSSSFKETKNKALGSGEDRHLPSASHHHHHLHDEHDDHGRGHHKRHRHRRKKKKKKETNGHLRPPLCRSLGNRSRRDP